MSSDLVKVTLEYPKKILTLRGKKARDWEDRLNSAAVMEWNHGHEFPDFGFTIKQKK